MSQVQVLAVGSNPNVLFYAWRLQETKSCKVSLVNSLIKLTIKFDAPEFSKDVMEFNPTLYGSLGQINSSKFDIVIISVSSLQDFQVICDQLAPLLNDDSVVVIESTGYVNLEPFVLLSLPNFKKLIITSIMNESDVKQISSDTFHRSVRNNDNRIYFGTSVPNSSINKSANFQRLYKLLQLVQQDSKDSVSLLKSTNAKEFMTYQWKLALPRICFNPLSIIFEEEFPINLSQQILCKPLITGIINEIFKIIKKMDCKLVKGSESEINLLKHWSSLYPITKNGENSTYQKSSTLFYNFYNQYDLEIDLLLLQPILLADDHGVRTPYLENLYSMMCQLIKYNHKNSNSIFFTRRLSLTDSNNLDKVNKQIDLKTNQLNLLLADLQEKSSHLKQLDSSIQEKLAMKDQMDSDLRQQQSNLNSLTEKFQKQSQDFALLQQNHENQLKSLNERILTMQLNHDKIVESQRNESQRYIENQNGSQRSIDNQGIIENQKNANMAAPSVPDNSNHKVVRDSVMTNDNLADLTDIALYGAELNGEKVPQQADEFTGQRVASSNSVTPPQDNTNLIINGRDQALIKETDNDNGFNNYNSNGFNGSNGYAANNVYGFNGYAPNQNGSYNYNQPQNGYYQNDQQPPHGLPTNGLPQNSMPLNSRKQQAPMNNQRRNPSMSHSQYDLQQSQQYQNQYQQMPPQQQYQQPYQQQPSQYQQRPYNPQFNDNSYPPQNHNQNYNPNMGQYNQMNQMPGQMMNPMQGMAKKPNRRSAFPGMDESSLRIDYGGRGGMPTSSINGANTTKAKHKSMLPMGSNPMVPVAQRKPSNPSLATENMPISQSQPILNNRSYSGGTHQVVQPEINGNGTSQQFLQPPNMNGSNTSTNSSSNSMNTGESPKTDNSPDIGTNAIRIDVPLTETPKPLGAIVDPNKSSTEKKKKRGFFGKKN